jgi:cytoskeletal protein RodZ
MELNGLLDRAAQLEIRLAVAESRLVALESGRIDVPIPRTFAREVTP